MTHTPDNLHRPRQGRPKSSTWMLLVIVALLAALAAAAGTMALWGQKPQWPEAQFVTTGNLEITSTADPIWRETSPDVTTAPREIDPDEFLIRAGDSVTVDYPFETTLVGDNMQGRLHVDWATDTRIPDTVFGHYSIHDEHGNEVTSAPALLGTDTIVDLAPPQEGGETASYTVRVHLDFAGLDDRFGADSVDQLDDLGDFAVELHQVRPGDETP